MSDQVAPRTCPTCTAELQFDAKTCWLCKRPIPAESSSGPTQASSKGPSSGGNAVTWDATNTVPGRERTSTSSRTFTIATVLVATALFAVGFELLRIAPGIAITLAILCVPAFIRTAMVVNRREQRGAPVTTLKKVGWFLGSIAATTIMFVVVLVASLGTFCATCLMIAGPRGGSSSEGFVFLATGVTTLLALALCFHWIGRRWKRDVWDK